MRQGIKKATVPGKGVLSGRETEVIVLFARGLSDKQAARVLGISDLTVRKHRSNMQAKLDASNICALLFEAVLAGWLELPLANCGSGSG